MSPVPLESPPLPTQAKPVVADRRKSMHDSDALDEALIESFPGLSQAQRILSRRSANFEFAAFRFYVSASLCVTVGRYFSI
jgi:hypothetical protein